MMHISSTVYLVVSGPDGSCKIHGVFRDDSTALAFVRAFANDKSHGPLRVVARQVDVGGFSNGLMPFAVYMDREGPAVRVDDAPAVSDFTESSPLERREGDGPLAIFYVWAGNRKHAEDLADNRRRLNHSRFWPQSQ